MILKTKNKLNPKAWFTKIQSQGQHTFKLSEINLNDYDAIYYIGGYGTIWGFKDNIELQKITKQVGE